PAAIARLASPAIADARAHPSGRPLNGTEASTGALARDRVVEFYRSYYRPTATQIQVVGDVTFAEVRELVSARLGAWEPAEGRAGGAGGAAAGAPEAAARAVYLIDKPGAAQSVIRIGHVGIARSSPDYSSLQVLNTILGGAFTSRLNQN